MLEMSGMNYWAILIAWIINIGIGSFWYSPMGFGKQWSKLSGVDMMHMPKDKANQAIGWVMGAGLVQTVVLAIILHSLHVTTMSHGLVTGLVLWLGFTAATTIGSTLYLRMSWKFWWINSGFFLVVMAINSTLLAIWR